MLKQQDMTETARVVFDELSVNRTGDSRGDCAEYLPFTRNAASLILTQLVMAGLADYQCGCYRRLQS